MDRINQRKIRPNASLLEAMKKMDTIGVKTLLVFDADKFIGLLTIGDIQRAIIKGTNLSSSILTILDKNKIYASIFDSQEVIQNNMKTLRAECMPVLDQNNELVDVLFWKDIFLNDDSNQ